MESFWTSVREANLQQGDLLWGCWIPQFPPDFADQTDQTREVEADQADLIVVTQSCDLEHGRLSLVALCPVWSIPAFEAAQAGYGRMRSGAAWRVWRVRSVQTSVITPLRGKTITPKLKKQPLAA